MVNKLTSIRSLIFKQSNKEFEGKTETDVDIEMTEVVENRACAI